MSDEQKKRMSDLMFISGFPEGETVYNCLRRNFGYSRVRDVPAAFKRKFHCKPGLRGTPTGLGEIHAVFAYRFRTLDELIAKNTEYPLYFKGLPEDKKMRLIERITGKVPGPARPTRPPLLFGASTETANYCPECSEQRLYDLGFTYQHLRENAPYVDYCPVHLEELRSANVQLPLYDLHCKEMPSACQRECSIVLSQRIWTCLDSNQDSSQFEKDQVIETLRRTGWLGENGRMNLALFIQSFCAFFAGSFFDVRLALLCHDEKLVHNAARALLRPDHGVFWLWCILFTWFANERPCKKVQQTRIPTERKAVPSPEEISTQLAVHKSLKATATAMDMPVSALTTLCRKYDLPIAWRAKKIDKNLTEAIYQAFSEGEKPADISRRLAVSKSTADRLWAVWGGGKNARVQERRALVARSKRVWLKLLEKHPDLPTTHLRRLKPGTWVALKRHAKEWLVEHQTHQHEKKPRKARRYPALLVKRVSQSLRLASAECQVAGLAPIRKSAYRFIRKSGLPESQLRRMKQLNFLPRVEESRADFIQRRIEHAVKNGASMDSPPWLLAKKSGLRRSSILSAAGHYANEFKSKNEN
ncbi:UNVERIFIED_ORG: hypothetical protein DFO49_4421 [Herbaspirillum seropedicae]